MVPDAATFELLIAGDHESFRWLVEAYSGALFRYFVAEHRDRQLGEEQTGEVFVQMVHSLPAMRGEASQLPAYVFAIARRVRSRSWRRSTPAVGALGDARPVVDASLSAAELLERQDDFEVVLVEIGKLEPAVRDILMFRYVECCSLEQVAAIVGLPLGTVKSHLHRGLPRLRKTFSVSDKIHD